MALVEFQQIGPTKLSWAAEFPGLVCHESLLMCLEDKGILPLDGLPGNIGFTIDKATKSYGQIYVGVEALGIHIRDEMLGMYRILSGDALDNWHWSRRRTNDEDRLVTGHADRDLFVGNHSPMGVGDKMLSPRLERTREERNE